MNIPTTIHRIWLGDKPMPDECIQWGEDWEKLNPEFHVKLWTDDMLFGFDMICREDFEAAEHPAMKADILRYELLYHLGGIYVDVDVEPKKPVGQLLEKFGGDAFVVLEDARGPWFGNAVLGASAWHPFMAKVLERMPDNITKNWARPINERTGPVYLTRVWESGDTAVFPRRWFFPYLHNEKHRRHEAFPDAYAVHHWMGSWQEGA